MGDTESNKVDDSKVKEKGSGEIENKEGNKVIDEKIGQKEQNSEIKVIAIDKDISESSKVEITSPNLDNKDVKKIASSSYEKIATDMSTKTVTSVASSVAGEQSVILDDSKSFDEGGEVKVKTKRKKKNPEDSIPVSGENHYDEVSSSSESTLKEKVLSKEKLPIDDKVLPGKEQTPGQDETGRSMEEAKEIMTPKSLENENKCKQDKDDKVDRDNISGGKDIKDTKLDVVNKIEEVKVKEHLEKTSQKEVKENSIHQIDDVTNQKKNEK